MIQAVGGLGGGPLLRVIKKAMLSSNCIVQQYACDLLLHLAGSGPYTCLRLLVVQAEGVEYLCETIRSRSDKYIQQAGAAQ
jgi:hypothetical protein